MSVKKLTLDPFRLPEGLKITSVRWEVNTKIDFTGKVLLDRTVYDSPYSVDLPFELSYKDIIYGKGTVNFSNGLSTGTTLLTITKNGACRDGNVFVYPPKIKIEERISLKDFLIIDVSKPVFFYGIDKHIATSYKLKDTAGNVLFYREADYDNLYHLEIPDDFYRGKDHIVVSVKYIFQNSDIEVWGNQSYMLKNNSADILLNLSSLDANKPNVVTVGTTTPSVKKYRVDITHNGTNVGIIESHISKPFYLTPATLKDKTSIDLRITIYTLFGTRVRRVTLPIYRKTIDNRYILKKDFTISEKVGFPYRHMPILTSSGDFVPLLNFSTSYIDHARIGENGLYKMEDSVIPINKVTSDRYELYFNNPYLGMIDFDVNNKRTITIIETADYHTRLVESFTPDILSNVIMFNNKITYINNALLIVNKDIETKQETYTKYDEDTIIGIPKVVPYGEDDFFVINNEFYMVNSINIRKPYAGKRLKNFYVYPFEDGAIVVGDDDMNKSYIYKLTSVDAILLKTLNYNLYNVQLLFNIEANELVVLKG